MKRKLPELSARIAELREAKGWTQGHLAKLVGVSRPAVTQWESGNTKNIKNEALVSLAHAFGMSVEELLTGEPYGVRDDSGSYLGAASKDEELLLEKYRRLSSDDRARLKAVLDAFNHMNGRSG